METNKHSLSKRQYTHISTAKRMKLLQLVLLKSHSISGSARHLAIALSTAKQIVKKYKATGQYFVAKGERTQASPTVVAVEANVPSISEFSSTEHNNNQNRELSSVSEDPQTQSAYIYLFSFDFSCCFIGDAFFYQTSPNWS